MKVALYFGSFNPIHNGHLIIASHAVQFTDIQEVWFVVSPQNPFKKANTLLNENHRLNLVRTAIEGENKIKASNVEFKLPKPSYTINTLAYLKEKYPVNEFCILLGSDGLQNIENWKNAETIIKEHELYVYERPGFNIIENSEMKVVKISAPLLDVSSTHIRSLLAKEKSIRYLVPDSVKEEIENNAYYKSTLENPS